jgi:Ca2+-binding EF-hand superfamily protein
MKGLGANLSDAEIALLIKEADVDGDGQISIQEFLRIMYS